MRVLHLIPAAWEYFDAIRDQAFELVEEETKLGIEAEAFTLQYGRVTDRFSSEVMSKSPSRSFQGMNNLDEVMASFEQFDIIHLHCPMLGALGRVLKWKKRFSDKPLLITYYGSFPITDLFGVFISWYNGWYLPKLFKQADRVVTQKRESILAKANNVFDLTDPRNEVQLMPVVYYKALYSQLV